MTGLIVIDESGDLGSNGTVHFVMAAMIMIRARHLKPASKIICHNNFEQKWHNSDSAEKESLFNVMERCQFSAVYSVIDKNNPKSRKKVYGNALYEMIIRQVVSDALSVLPCRDVNVYLDRNRFISEKKFREIVTEECSKCGANLKNCCLKDSQSNPCIQLVDFVAGAVFSKYEHNDRTLEIIHDKVSVARRY